MFNKIKQTVSSEEFKAQAKEIANAIVFGVVVSVAIKGLTTGIDVAVEKIGEARNKSQE